MKNIPHVWRTLTDLAKCQDLYIDVKEEVTTILDTLKPLEKPNKVRVTGNSSQKQFNQIK